jgi:hypothetical protein
MVALRLVAGEAAELSEERMSPAAQQVPGRIPGEELGRFSIVLRRKPRAGPRSPGAAAAVSPEYRAPEPRLQTTPLPVRATERFTQEPAGHWAAVENASLEEPDCYQQTVREVEQHSQPG